MLQSLIDFKLPLISPAIKLLNKSP
ncbi:hypothetical protein THOG10_120021 [Vibrio rotiferianus]|nr:hypothetical protein THOG10_120021 [Vibrio rotiferianus]